MVSKHTSAKDLNALRRRAVQLRLSGNTLADVRDEVGLSTPTIISAVKAFKDGGWAAVDVKPRGRPKLNEAQHSNTAQAQKALFEIPCKKPWAIVVIKCGSQLVETGPTTRCQPANGGQLPRVVAVAAGKSVASNLDISFRFDKKLA